MQIEIIDKVKPGVNKNNFEIGKIYHDPAFPNKAGFCIFTNEDALVYLQTGHQISIEDISPTDIFYQCEDVKLVITY